MFSGASIDAVRILGEPAAKETFVILERIKPLGGRIHNKPRASNLQHLESVRGGVRNIDRRP